ncbi:cyclic GMP-AMP synthase DncV-like nucleotidyltransferase [Nonomuraea sp. NPDC049655]|uniref:cyclic GMP-AMP synthase DncV-like nucleotidyltransferase n=1 Tax=Nonomuraea sp. NPDC049655 TaxID=3364355 RepID=UPI0037BB4D34
MDTLEEMLSDLLDGAVETLDIAPYLYRLAVRCYEDVGTWLAERGKSDWRIYPQGSFLLGTVVRPHTPRGEYDIDLVCRLPVAKESTTQAKLKELIGDELFAFMQWKKQQGAADGPKGIDERRRCWTLDYSGEGFHLDVLPTIPDVERPPTGILLTDKVLPQWQRSNPIGYAEWFKDRSELTSYRIEAATKRHVNVADVPEWEIRTPLQRVVQILKWHTMLRFANNPDNRPPSILITTLAAQAYEGERDLFTATSNVLSRMRDSIENRDGEWWVPNPAHKKENFTDKWNEYPERREAFFRWHSDISSVLHDLIRMENKGLDIVAKRMSEGFAPEPIMRSFERMGERQRELREAGNLHMAPTGRLTTAAAGPRVRGHGFFGQHAADSRD